MAKDLEIVQEIEKTLGITLKQVAYADILEKEWIDSQFILQAYSIDENSRVIGLSLDRLRIDKIAELIIQLTSLRTLSLSAAICSDFAFIQKLPQLNTLLKSLTNVTNLDLSNNNITDLSDLKSLTNLTSLNLKNNKLTDLSDLQSLINLTNLNLSINKLTDLSSLKSLSNLTSLDLSGNSIIDLSGLKSLTNLTSLNLNNNKLTDLSDLKSLTNLTSLDLKSNKLTDLSDLKSLTNLTSLDLRNNKLTDLSDLKSLANLTSLNLSRNKPTDLSDLKSLTNLTNLDLSDNELTDLSDLKSLTNLKSLVLWGNNITDLSDIKSLINLTNLNLSSNKLTDLSSVKSLSNLTSLDLSGNSITDLSGLKSLTNLTSLDLMGNNITDLNGLKSLTNLTSLYLSGNSITDLSGLKSLTNLTNLYLSSNNIYDISHLEELSNLNKLYLGNNKLTEIPTFILIHPHLMHITLRNNPIKDIEPVLLADDDTCLQKVRDYYQALDKYDYVINNEIKLLLLGNGRVGKSSIVNQLTGRPFDPLQSSTHGIQLLKWFPPTDQQQPLEINIHDFGGQDIYQGTHRLFMASKTLYLLVWDGKQEYEPYYTDENGHQFENYPIVYWLDYIQTFSPQSPVIIIQNKTDLTGKRPPDNYTYLKGHYRIADYCSISAATREGVPELQTVIKRSIEEMSEVGRKLPKPWFTVKEQLKDMAENEKQITFEKYQSLCEAGHLWEISETSAHSLLSFLHDSGVLYYRKGLFQNAIILDQKWAIEAVYTLFDRSQVFYRLLEKGNGRFTRKDLADWAWQKYSPAEQEVFLGFMESCELCFKVNEYSSRQTEYIVPQLLPTITPDLKYLYWEAGGTNLLFLIYDHQFFHQGILHRFINRIGQLACNDPQGFFKDFIVFQDSQTQTKACVEFLPPVNGTSNLGGRILIKVKGNHSKELLDKIRNEFAELNENAVVKELVSVNGVDFVELEWLKKQCDKWIKQFLSLQDNPVNTDDFKVFFSKTIEDGLSPDEPGKEKNRELIVMSQSVTPVKKVFISYSHKNSDWLEKLKTHLDALPYITDRIDIWEDTRIGKGAIWKEEIAVALESAEVAILLISKEFLASEFIRNDEVPCLLRAAEEKGTRLLMLIINTCVFGLIERLSRYQTINPPDRLLADLTEKEQDEYFVRVVGEVVRIGRGENI